MSPKFVYLLLPIIFLLGFFAGNLFPHKLYQPPLIVTSIVDGDTFDLSDGRRLRLRAVNAPELTKNDCLGSQAKERLAQILLNQKVTLKEKSPAKDNFGRTLATPLVKGVDASQILLKEGLARVMDSFLTDENEKQTLFNLEEQAKDQQLGVYNPKNCPTPIPQVTPSASCNIKGNVHWKKRQKLYFPPGCTGYDRIVVDPKNGDAWFCSIDEAVQAGFSLSSTCQP